MKRSAAAILFVSLLVISGSKLPAQVVVTVPVYPTDLDSCTVIFDATQGNAGLKDVTPPIYAHTGVITDQSTGPSDWKYVLAPWDQNISKAMMTPLGNNLYEIKMKPSIRAWYGVPSGEKILKMAFVFRNSDGSKSGREANGGDIFTDVYPAYLDVNIISPASKSLYLNLNDTIEVNATSPLADTMKLYINGVLTKTVAGTSMTTNLLADNFGQNWVKQWVRIMAKNDTASRADSFSYTVMPPPDVMPLPAGVMDGINYIDSATVVLCLFAPHKKSCSVIGDFENWEIDSVHYMYRTPDGNRYWIQVSNLIPKKEYLFQYLVDGNLRIADPYCDKVCDPDDQYISPSTYPGLLLYPSGKTTGIASYLQTDQDPYPWNTGAFTPPKVTDLVIYELLLRDFLADHDYPSLEDTLDYLERLGVNAVELMPVMEFEGNSSWGYNPDFMFAPDKYYGPKNALKHFIEAAHAKGIAVILDIVLNHQFGKSPLVRLYWDGANNRPAENSPWFNPIPKHPYNVGFDFNHESSDTRAFCDRVITYWVNEYHIDGYRFDLSKGFTQKNSYPNNVALWGQYDASRIAILEHYYDTLKQVKPGIILILEHFADNSEEKVLSADGMLLWGNLNYNYGQATGGWTTGSSSDFSGISYKQRGWTDPHLVGYMESHDEERLMYKNISLGKVQAPYSTRDTTTALKRMEEAACFFYTIPGPKMIWEFGELGYDYSINFNGDRLAPKPPRWDYPDQWRRSYLYRIHSYLIDLKKNLDLFETTDYSTSLAGPMKKIHLTANSIQATVLGNFDVVSGEIIPAFQHPGWWYDYFSGDSLEVTDVNATISLEPGEYHLYTSLRFPKPPYTGIESPATSAGKQDVLVFPNPSSGMITILAVEKIRLVDIYSMTGKLLITRDHSDHVDIGSLAPGIYLVKITFISGRQEIVKIARGMEH